MFEELVVEQLGFDEMGPVAASFYFALVLGIVFGMIGQHTKFCFRRGVVGDPHERSSARGVWFTAFAVAILGTQFAVMNEWIDFSDHRYLASDLPFVAIIIGGLMFGAGMVFTRGCISRLTVLTGTGNTRAFVVLIVFAIAAHATLKGILAPVRVGLGAYTIDLGETVTFGDLPGGAMAWSVVLFIIALGFVYRSGAKPLHLVLAVLLGLLVPLGWVGTGLLLADEFDPIAVQSLSFTSPSADLLFWTIASSSIPATFGVALPLGVVLGSLITALPKGEFKWQSFEDAPQTLRYILGAILMGIGGVLAGGCTVGAGLSGAGTLSFAAILALISIAIGAIVTRRFLADGKARTILPAE